MRLRSQAGRRRRRVSTRDSASHEFCFDCFDVSLWINPTGPGAQPAPEARSSVLTSVEKPRRDPAGVRDYLPSAGSNVSSRISAARVDAPWKHNDISTGYLLFSSEGERGEGSCYAVLRRRSAVLITRSANCEQRKRL